MKILALDIGTGTLDILLYDSRRNIENCVKLILPAPHLLFAAQVHDATRQQYDLFIQGDVIGGGALTSALRNHLKQELRVIMTEQAAYTVRNNLDAVRELGIETVRHPFTNFQGSTIHLEEVLLTPIREFLSYFNEPLCDLDAIAVAVQDHGVFPRGTSNRQFRIQTMKTLLTHNPRPEHLAFIAEEIPTYFLRMRSAAQASRRHLSQVDIYVMDTSPAAILGCLVDIKGNDAAPVLVVNVGNGHTMAALVNKETIIGVMEHHTHLLTPQKLERLLMEFANGTLSDRVVFNDNGHGLFYLDEPPGFSQIETIAATGPNRAILSRTTLPIHYSAPGGDVMITGPIGLIEAVKRKLAGKCQVSKMRGE
jgi:uncharacterized protein (DUF1786 family)